MRLGSKSKGGQRCKVLEILNGKRGEDCRKKRQALTISKGRNFRNMPEMVSCFREVSATRPHLDRGVLI